VSKLKILHINASTAGGAFTVAQRLSIALQERGIVQSEHLVFEGKKGKYVLWANSYLKMKFAFSLHALDKLDFLRFEKNKQMRFLFNHGSTGIDISNHPLVKEADILHLHWVHKGFQSFQSLNKLLKLGKPIVWTCHDLWPVTGGCYYTWECNNHEKGCGNCQFLKNGNNKDLSHRLFLKKEELWGNNEIRFLTPSNWLANIGAVSRIMTKNRPFTVIPNPIDCNAYFPSTSVQKQNHKKHFGLDETLPVILFAAASLTNRAKGFHEFQLLCNQLKAMDSNVQILIIGDLKDGTIEINLPYKHLGFVSDENIVKMAYGASDVYVTTSLEDNLPTTVMESLSCGLISCGFKVGGIPELIDHDENGFIVEKGDVNSLAGCILGILNNSDKFQKFSTNARKKALDSYDLPVVCAQIEKVYNEESLN